MKATTHDTKLTHKQWAALWQIAFGNVQLNTRKYGRRTFTEATIGDKIITTHVRALKDKGMIKLHGGPYTMPRLHWALTKKGQEYL